MPHTRGMRMRLQSTSVRRARLQRCASLLISVFVITSSVMILLAPQRSVHAANTFMVITNADIGGTCAPGPDCSLRQALNSVGSGDVISFGIGSGPQTITLTLGDLPTITQPIIIDGST